MSCSRLGSAGFGPAIVYDVEVKLGDDRIITMVWAPIGPGSHSDMRTMWHNAALGKYGTQLRILPVKQAESSVCLG